MKKFTDVIVHDIFSPPVASRNYVYPCIAAYEVLRHQHTNYHSLVGQLKALNGLPAPEEEVEYCYPLASEPEFGACQAQSWSHPSQDFQKLL